MPGRIALGLRGITPTSSPEPMDARLPRAARSQQNRADEPDGAAGSVGSHTAASSKVDRHCIDSTPTYVASQSKQMIVAFEAPDLLSAR